MALKVLTDFEHAAVEKVRVVEADRTVYFAAPLGTSPRGMWFHFKLAGGGRPDGSPVTCVLTNREQMLGRGDYRRAVPVYRREGGGSAGAAWRRVDPQQCLTEESPEAAGLPVDLNVASGFFLFRVPCGTGAAVTEVAYCYPYTVDMLDAAIGRWAGAPNRKTTRLGTPAQAARADRAVEVLTLCRTQNRRPLRVVRIGRPGPGKKVVWVLARQHSGEAPGSYAAEGLIDAVLSRAAWAASLRRRAVLFVCPAVDVDGVAQGMYGKDRSPIDFNRDWCGYPIRPEIRALRRAMESSRLACAGANGRMLAVVDLHAPGPGTVSFPVPPHPAWAGLDAWQQAWRLAKLIEKFAGERSPIRWANSYADHIDWSPPAFSCRPTSSFHAACRLADYSMSVELTYSWQVNGSLVTPDDWRHMGQGIGRALETAARQARPMARVHPPEPPFYLSPSWGWLNVPRQCNARVSDDRISIQADGPQGYAAVLFREPIALSRRRLSVRADLYRTSRGKGPMQRLMFFFRNGVFTGEVSEQSGDMGGQDELFWRGPAARKHPADSVRVGLVIRNWQGTVTIAGLRAE